MTKRIDELVQSICGATAHPLAPLLRRWCEESRLFVVFAEAHASKIHKKVRLATSDDALADLCAELGIAAFLVRDRRFSALYEPHHTPGTRAPDFELRFKTHSALYVEVTRLRLRDTAEDGLTGTTIKLARVVCDKIGQFPPGAMNLLAVVLPLSAASATLAPTAIRLLDNYPQREALPSLELRLDDVRAFTRQRQRLSAIALCSFTPDWQPERVQLWLNPQAKHPLSPDVIKYLVQTTP